MTSPTRRWSPRAVTRASAYFQWRQLSVFFYTEPNRTRRTPPRHRQLDPQCLTFRPSRRVGGVFGDEERERFMQCGDRLAVAHQLARVMLTHADRQRYEFVALYGECDGDG